MNKIHRVVWNEVTATWVAVAEIAKGHGKGSGTVGPVAGPAAAPASLCLPPFKALVASLALIGVFMGTVLPTQAWAQVAANQLPTGGNVVAGTASITPSANTGAAVLNIDQSTNRAAIDWNTFNVGRAAQVNFNQPSSSSVTLNRVLDSNPSQIFGKINAPGQVFLTNANGVYFAPGASVDVGGLVATTHSISTADFMAGKATFDRNGSTGSVLNAGELKAALGGYIALLAPEVRNEGVIIAQAGTVALASGEAISLNFADNGTLAGITATKSQIDALVENKNAVLAPGGLIILSAMATNSLQGGVINHSGSLEASSLTEKGGRIILEGDTISLSGSSQITATGATGGGEVLVGGDWQGGANEERRVFDDPDALHQATTVTMEQGATIDVSATRVGDGGTAVLWTDVLNSQSRTTVAGTLLAQGGPEGGAGGKVETSGHTLKVDGAAVSTLASDGSAGDWLLDPISIFINSSGTQYDTITSGGTTSFESNGSTTNGNSYIAASAIQTALNSNNVTIMTTVGTGDGDIVIQDDGSITYTGSSARTLSLRADRDIYINENAFIKSTNGGDLEVLLNADRDADNSGAVMLRTGSSIVTSGGNIFIGGGTNLGSDFADNSPNIKQGVLLQGSTTIDAGGGNIYIRGSTDSSTDGWGIQQEGTVKTSGSGTITYVGNASGSSDINSYGVLLKGATVQAATGAISITGTGGTGSNSTGVMIENGSTITSTSGAINLTGTYNNSSGNGIATQSNPGNNTIGGSSTTGAITLVTNKINLASGTSVNTSGTLTVRPSTNSGLMAIGTGTGTLSLPSSYFSSIFNTSISEITLGGSTTTGAVDVDSITLNSNLQIWTSGAWSGSGTITTTGNTVTLNTSNTAWTVGQVISGTSGQLVKEGTGTVTLTGANTYTGATTISGGTLKLQNTSALSNSTDVTVNGTLDLNNYSNTIDGLSGSGSVLTGGATLTVGAANGGGTFSGSISETNGKLTKTGTGTLILSGVNTYTGATTITGGTLRLQNTSALSNSTDVTVNSGATLDLNNFNNTIDGLSGAGSVLLGGATLTVGANNATSDFTGVISESGNLIKTGSGTLTLSNNNTYTGTTTISGLLNVGTGGTTGTLGGGNIINNGFLTFNRSNNFTVSNAISGSGRVIKQGNGTLTLSGNNSYGGTTTVSAGSLAVTSNTALGSTTNGTSVASGATLDLRGVNIGAEDITALNGTLSASTGTSSLSGNVYLQQANTPISVGSGAQLTLSGNLTEDPIPFFMGLNKTGAGTLILTGNSPSYTGTTTVSAGTLSVGSGGTSGKLGSGAVINNATLLLDRSDIVSLSTLAANAAGITGTGNLTAQIGGGFTIDRPISQTGASSRISLAAGDTTAAGTTSGGDLSFSGTGSITTGSNGTVTLFSGNPNTSTFDGKITGATGATKNKTYNSASTAMSGAVSGTRNYYYRSAPLLTVSGLTASKIYNGNTSAVGYTSAGTVSGNIDGDAAYAIGNLTLSTATFNTKDVGSKTLAATFTAGSRTSGGWAVSGYRVNNFSGAGAGTISAKTVGLSASKVYDGLLDLTDDVIIITGVGGETLTYTNAAASDAHVATVGKYIRDITLGNGSNGGLASNYQLPTLNAANAPVTITARPLTAEATIIPASKTYDGGLVATGSTVIGSVNGLVGSDSMTLDTSGVVLAFNSARVAAATTISASGSVAIGTLTSTGRGNADGSSVGNEVASASSDYGMLDQPNIAEVAGTITPATLNTTITNTGVTKVYDGTTNAPAGFTPSYGAVTGFITGDTAATFSYTSATYDSKHVANASKLTVALAVTGITGTNGSAATDYVVGGSGIDVAATITPKSLDPTAGTVSFPVSKVYDGTTIAPSTLQKSNPFGGFGTEVTLSATSTNYNSKDVLTASAVSYSGLSIQSITDNLGGQPSDYALTGTTLSGISGEIKPKEVGLAASKVYDGLLDLTGYVAVTTGVGSETLTYSNANAIAAHVTSPGNHISAMTLNDGSNGGLASNYKLPTLGSTYAPVTITARPLSATAGITGVDKIYDGLLVATGSSISGTTIGAINGDSVALDTSGYTLAFNSAHVTAATTISASGTAALGAVTGGGTGSKDGTAGNAVAGQAGDYFLDQTTVSSVSNSITPKTLTASLTNTGVTKVYDGTTDGPSNFTASWSLGGFIAGDTDAALSYASSTYDSVNVDSASRITLDGLSISGVTGNNSSQPGDYALDATSKYVLASITRADATVTANSATVAYNGVAQSVSGFTVSGLVNGETASVLSSPTATGASGTNPGSYIHSVSGTAIDGNYNLSFVAGNLEISRRSVTVTADAKNKTEGLSDPVLTYVAETQNGNRGLVTGETLVGSLAREPGEIIGVYGIQQGTVNDASNSNYSIEYVAASLTINTVPPPPVEPPVIDSSPLPPDSGSGGAGFPSSPNQLLNVDLALAIPLSATEESSLDGGSASGQLGAGGISISLDSTPSGNLGSGVQNAVVTVSLPKAMVTAGTGFSFELPAEVRESLGTGVLQATLADGSPLPGWIQLNPATQRFEAGAVPDGGLPLQVLIRASTTQVLVLIFERGE